VSGSGQSAEISQTLVSPFIVQVNDAFGNPVSDESVSFSISGTPVDAVGQTLGTTTVLTDANGQAATTLTLGDRTGTYSVDAVWTTQTVTFTADATEGSFSGFEIETISSPQTAGTGFSISVRAVDSGNNTVTGYNQTAVLGNTVGDVAPATLTFANGLVTETVTITQAGTGQALTVTDGAISETSNTFDVNAAAADAASSTATVPAGTAGVATTLTVDLVDGFGNPVSGEAGNLAASVTGGPNSGAAVSAFSDDGGGSYSASYTPTATGDDEITITLGGTGISGSPYTSTVSAGAAASFSFDAIGSPQQVGAAFGITITALDSEGNTADGYTGTANLATTAGTITPVTATFTAGVASLSVDVTDAGTGQTITATDGVINGTSNAFDVDPDAVSASVSSVTATSPHTADGADASTVTIVVQDANGNAITGLTDTDFAVGLGASSASPGTVVETGTPGTYTVSVTNTVAESVTVIITADGVILDDTPSIIFQI
jgi:hypothetical protein